MKKNTIHLSLDDQTARIMKGIPDNFRSKVLRSLLQAYEEFSNRDLLIPAHYMAMSGHIKVVETEKAKETVDAT